jgi:ornithine cyclodeaminase/alanine dehydrogenase-like protein (mu-crystallin family)
MLRFYSAAQVHAALEWHRLADALAAAFARGAEVPLRHAHRLSEADTLLLMPAWTDSALGVKLVTVIPGAAAHGASTVSALYVLLDRATGQPRAALDGEALTLRRTAATSALAARHMARADASELLVIGTGKLAPYMLRAHCALRPRLRRARLWGRSAAKAQTLAQSLRDEGLPVEVAGDLEGAVRSADIVSCATTASTPIVSGAWLAAGAHLDLVGGFTLRMREADDAAAARSRIVVDTYRGALAEAGDIAQPLQGGAIRREQIVAELAELVRGERIGRQHDDEITLFKSVGTALEDLAAAGLVVEAA